MLNFAQALKCNKNVFKGSDVLMMYLNQIWRILFLHFFILIFKIVFIAGFVYCPELIEQLHENYKYWKGEEEKQQAKKASIDMTKEISEEDETEKSWKGSSRIIMYVIRGRFAVV